MADQLRIRQATFRFWYHKCNHKTVMKYARGQNKLFQNASHLMCFCTFATGYFFTLKTQFVRRVIEFMFTDQISPDNSTRNTH